MAVLVALRVRMFMVMIMDERMIMLAVVQALARPWTARIFAEHQRFDRDRHGVGRHADAAEIDIVEVPQHYAVDDQKVAANAAFVAKEMPERVRHVAVQHDVERQASGSPLGETALDAFGESSQPRVGRGSAPAQGERNVAVGVIKVERRDVIADRVGEFVRIDPLCTEIGRQQHLQIAARQ